VPYGARRRREGRLVGADDHAGQQPTGPVGRLDQQGAAELVASCVPAAVRLRGRPLRYAARSGAIASNISSTGISVPSSRCVIVAATVEERGRSR